MRFYALAGKKTARLKNGRFSLLFVFRFFDFYLAAFLHRFGKNIFDLSVYGTEIVFRPTGNFFP